MVFLLARHVLLLTYLQWRAVLREECTASVLAGATTSLLTRESVPEFLLLSLRAHLLRALHRS